MNWVRHLKPLPSAQKTVRERLAEVLLLLEQKLGTDPEGFIKISLTREEIANLVGTATESAIRLISEFKQDELISVDGRNIRILNHDKLKIGTRIYLVPFNLSTNKYVSTQRN